MEELSKDEKRMMVLAKSMWNLARGENPQANPPKKERTFDDGDIRIVKFMPGKLYKDIEDCRGLSDLSTTLNALAKPKLIALGEQVDVPKKTLAALKKRTSQTNKDALTSAVEKEILKALDHS